MTTYTKIAATGSGQFPIDMLRFAQAWPATQSDSNNIERDPHAFEVGEVERTVTLLTDQSPTPHAMERWDSFGWRAKIIGMD